MSERVKDAELSRSASVEKTRILQEENSQLLIKVKNLETLVSRLKNEKSKIQVEVDVISCNLIKRI